MSDIPILYLLYLPKKKKEKKKLHLKFYVIFSVMPRAKLNITNDHELGCSKSFYCSYLKKSFFCKLFIEIFTI